MLIPLLEFQIIQLDQHQISKNKEKNRPQIITEHFTLDRLNTPT